ncbi:MATE family efflux transporter [Maledivibacter halophilus]|uniref:Probable multidrug resistance protein NorM n=1 Tax=Maledivibacter halophilus TaxID=36842 RepID=A0A1T5KH97_9FIRM|nr:MATE family efflux transporter [Maledivibacter halophilus]SKC63104.1 putative efflux protein, MATE family [Maledivibacter halophilus]
MNHLQKRTFILEGKMSKVIYTLALPIMLNNLSQTLYNLADAFWVSKIGEIEFAATAFVWPVLFLIISLGMGMNIAGTALISQHIGANESKEANKVAGQLFIFSIIISLLFAVIGFILTPYIIKLMGAQGNLFTFSREYLGIMFFDIPILFIVFVFTAIRQGQGDTTTPMVINVSSVILNVILDPIFIFTLNLGIKGAAIATILSKAVFAAYIIYLLFFRKNGIHITLKDIKLKKEIISKIIRVGLPASLGQAGSAFGFIVLNGFVVSFGDYTLAAFGIGNRINSLVLMPAMGVGSALATIIGQNMGADNIDRTREAFKQSLLMVIGFLFIGSIVLIPFSENVIKIFAENLVVISEGTYYLKLIAASMPLMGVFNCLMGVFQGSGHTIYTMYMNLGRLWGLRIPMILLFKNFTDLGSKSVWFAMVISNFIICCFGMIIYMRGKWQKKVNNEYA